MFCHNIFQNSSSRTSVQPGCSSADAWTAWLEYTQTHNPARQTITHKHSGHCNYSSLKASEHLLSKIKHELQYNAKFRNLHVIYFSPTILVTRTLAAAVKLIQISRTKINEVLSQFCFSTWVLSNYVELHPHEPHSLQRVHTSEIYWNLVFSNPVLEIGHSGISILYCKVLSFAQTVQNKSNLSFHREPWPQQNLRNRNLIDIIHDHHVFVISWE